MTLTIDEAQQLQLAINRGLSEDEARELCAKYARPHPAKFSDAVLDAIGKLLPEIGVRPGAGLLDPFAGVGKIHEFLCRERDPEPHQQYYTFAIELEPEWAIQSVLRGATWCGDFFAFDPMSARMGLGWPERFDAVITSPTYANRMADNHNARERCRPCAATGINPLNGLTCDKCKGEGRRHYERMTYTHKLARKLTANNSGGMRWGDKYRAFHRRAWRWSLELTDVMVVNVKNHIRKDTEVDVAGWHRDTLEGLGCEMIADVEIETPGMRNGENREKRVAGEHVMVFRREE